MFPEFWKKEHIYQYINQCVNIRNIKNMDFYVHPPPTSPATPIIRLRGDTMCHNQNLLNKISG